MIVHELKTHPIMMGDIRAGLKKCEFRRNDRGFAVGDTLLLKGWDPEKEQYTDDRIILCVTHLLEGPIFGIPEGFVLMSVTTPPNVVEGEVCTYQAMSRVELREDGMLRVDGNVLTVVVNDKVVWVADAVALANQPKVPDHLAGAHLVAKERTNE